MSDVKKYTIPLRKGFQKAAPLKRAPKAMRTLRIFVKKHCKVDSVKVGPMLNAAIWARGIKRPPAKVEVGIKVEDAVAKVELVGHDYVDFKVLEKKEDESLKDKLVGKLAGKAKGVDSKEEKPSEDLADKVEKAPAKDKSAAKEEKPAEKKEEKSKADK